MERTKFEWLLDDLELLFNPIAETKKKREAKIDIYFEKIGEYPESILKEAVDYLIETHPYARFPNIREFSDAIKEVSTEIKLSLPGEKKPPCADCDDQGYILEPYFFFGREYTRAVLCDCEIGQQKLEGWRRFFIRKKSRRNK